MPLGRLPGRTLDAARRHLWRRVLPHGLISWRYLLPNPPARVRIHRRLWLMGRPPRLPLPLYLLMELGLWLRWVTFSGWVRTWRALRWRGEMSLPGLARLLRLSLGRCLPPGEACAFGLHRSGAAGQTWDYVFSTEVAAFHRWRNGYGRETEAALALVQDKYGLAAVLEGRGVAVVPTLALIPRGTPPDPESWPRPGGGLFGKPRHGSASRDSFVLGWVGPGEALTIQAVRQGMKSGPATLDDLARALGRDDFLLQPLLVNHPWLARLCATDDAATLRVITEVRPERGVIIGCVTLELPGPDGRCHTILPVQAQSGLVAPFPAKNLPSRERARYAAILGLTGGEAVPFWPEVARSALAAHGALPALRAIAWDYIITPAGPRLLEGNSGWGATTPQILLGGLLREAAGGGAG